MKPQGSFYRLVRLALSLTLLAVLTPGAPPAPQPADTAPAAPQSLADLPAAARMVTSPWFTSGRRPAARR
jgi:hypothetical protein